MFRRLIAVFGGLLATGGCSSAPLEGLPANQPGSFALTELDSKDTPDGVLKTWRATSRGSSAPFSFRLEMLIKPPKPNHPFSFSKGAILRESGADGRHFLKEVARAIESEVDAPDQAAKSDRLDVSTAILGTSLSRESGKDVVGGSFTSTKPGHWIALKLFFAEGEGEAYLNLNPVAGVGEFAAKDPEYGEVVLRELATVFLP